MARVYRAYHPQLDRYVAVKVMRSDLADDEEFQVRFQREARAVAALRHPNIVQVFDFDTEGDVSYMVMELMEGDTLKTRVNDYRIRGEQMSWGEMVRVLLDVLEGLAYAHSEGMIHRDIKPGNILLTRRGQAVLGDFGIAHIIGGTRYTVPNALMGTLQYMAPEQGLEGRSDARSDIYSLGIVFYEMLTQHRPFDADTPLAVLMKHVNDPLPLPRSINPEIPEAFERIVLKSLAKKPGDRYQSAVDMNRALRAAAEEADIELPTRISLPLSFSTVEAPSESVAVISGTTRKMMLEADFADDETDVTSGRRRMAQPAPEAKAGKESELAEAGKELLGAVGTVAQVALTRTTDALRKVTETSGLPGVHAAATSISDQVEEALIDESPPDRVGLAILSAIGCVAFGNMLMLMVPLITNKWGIYERGWPIELLLVALGLSLIMHSAASIWFTIPIGIISGTGVILAYCALTYNWEYWIFLWFFEILVVIGSIALPIMVSKRGVRVRALSRQIAWLAGAVLVGLIALIATVITLGRWLIPLVILVLLVWSIRHWGSKFSQKKQHKET